MRVVDVCHAQYFQRVPQFPYSAARSCTLLGIGLSFMVSHMGLLVQAGCTVCTVVVADPYVYHRSTHPTSPWLTARMHIVVLVSFPIWFEVVVVPIGL